MKYLEQDLRNKNVLSVDETWLGMTDYRQRKALAAIQRELFD